MTPFSFSISSDVTIPYFACRNLSVFVRKQQKFLVYVRRVRPDRLPQLKRAEWRCGGLPLCSGLHRSAVRGGKLGPLAKYHRAFKALHEVHRGVNGFHTGPLTFFPAKKLYFFVFLLTKPEGYAIRELEFNSVLLRPLSAA